jgi:superfamily I DNA/RNA helicase
MIEPADWTPAGRRRLEPNAMLSATERERNVLAIAGPGAGKTEMLAQRADFLLRTGCCPYPRRILAISFKTDAAENLRKRVAERCGRDLARRMDSHTFHAFAKRLIDHYRVVLTGDDALDHDYEVGQSRILRRRITFDDMVPLATEILASSSNTVKLEPQRCSLGVCLALDGSSLSRNDGCRTWCRSDC